MWSTNMHKYLVVSVISILLGAFLALKFQKPKIIKEEVIVEKEKVVVDEKIVTVIKEIKKPDGTVITETTKTEDRNTVTQSEKQEKKLDLAYRREYLIGFQRNLNTNTNSVSIQKEIFNNVYIGVGANEKSEFSFGISIAF